MGLRETIEVIHSYLRWVRVGKSEINRPPTIISSTNKLKGEAVNNLIPQVLNSELVRWRYDFDLGQTELGDPVAWTNQLPTWSRTFPYIKDKTLNFVNADSTLGCPPNNTEYALTLNFRDMVTEWRFHTFFSSSSNIIQLEVRGDGNNEGSEFQGNKDQLLDLINEAWTLAAHIRRETSNPK